MRRVTVLVFAMLLGISATGCIIAIGTGRHAWDSDCGAHLVEIDGETYVVDVEKGTVREADEETVIGITVTED